MVALDLFRSAWDGVPAGTRVQVAIAAESNDMLTRLRNTRSTTRAGCSRDWVASVVKVHCGNRFARYYSRCLLAAGLLRSHPLSSMTSRGGGNRCPNPSRISLASVSQS